MYRAAQKGERNDKIPYTPSLCLGTKITERRETEMKTEKKKKTHQNLRFLNLKENLKNNELKRRLRRFEHMALSSVLFEKLPQVLFHLCKLDCPLLWNDTTPGGRCFHLCAGQQLYRVPKSGEAVKRVRTLKGTN